MTKVTQSEKFRDRLKEAVRCAGLNQREFAERMNVRESTVSNWIRGEREPGLEDLLLMTVELRVSADWLLGVSKSPPPTDVQELVQERVKRASVEIRDAVLAVLGKIEK